jgi:hypothetical protein
MATTMPLPNAASVSTSRRVAPGRCRSSDHDAGVDDAFVLGVASLDTMQCRLDAASASTTRRSSSGGEGDVHDARGGPTFATPT